MLLMVARCMKRRLRPSEGGAIRQFARDMGTFVLGQQRERTLGPTLVGRHVRTGPSVIPMGAATRLTGKQRPKHWMASTQVCKASWLAGGSSSWSSTLCVRLPTVENARKVAGLVRVRKAILTQFFARPPTARKGSAIRGLFGWKSSRSVSGRPLAYLLQIMWIRFGRRMEVVSCGGTASGWNLLAGGFPSAAVCWRWQAPTALGPGPST